MFILRLPLAGFGFSVKLSIISHSLFSSMYNFCFLFKKTKTRISLLPFDVNAMLNLSIVKHNGCKLGLIKKKKSLVDDEFGESQRPLLRVGVFVGHGPRICFPTFEVKRSILLDFARKGAVFNHLSFETKISQRNVDTQAITTMDRFLLFLSLPPPLPFFVGGRERTLELRLRGLPGIKYVSVIRIQTINN